MASKTDSCELFHRIRNEFFLNPRSSSCDIARIQAILAILTGNMMEWYVAGRKYQQLKYALLQADDFTKFFIHHLNARTSPLTPDESAPYVTLPRWTSSRIVVPYDAPATGSLVEAIRIMDTDTGGAIRFNHHFLGELHPQGNLLALAASIVASFLNENAVTPKVSPSLTTWEEEVVKWIWRMISDDKLPSGADGRLVSGGTIANLTAACIAMQRYRTWCKRRGINTAEHHPLLLISPHAHYSMAKVARIVGLNCAKVRLASDLWRMTGDDLTRAIHNKTRSRYVVVMVSALAGATDTGYVDDLRSIATAISQYNASSERVGPRIYFHVDAAYGGPFILVNRGLFKGIMKADAITVDGHKYLYCNYPCGGIFVKRKKDFDCLAERADYLFQGERERKWFVDLWNRLEALARAKGGVRASTRLLSKDILYEEWRLPPDRRTLEGSRGVHGVTQLYLILKVLNVRGLSVLLSHAVEMAQYLKELIRTQQLDSGPSLELLSDGSLNTILFRFVYDWQRRFRDLALDNRINNLIPHYLRLSHTQANFPLASEFFYVGADSVPSHGLWSARDFRTFLSEVYKLNNGRDELPMAEWRRIEHWLSKRDKADRKLHVLKAIVTHPYTDEAVLRNYVQAILRTGHEIGKLLKERPRGRRG